MGSEWKTSKLVDLTSLIKRVITPKYAKKNGISVINQRCIRDQRVSFDSARKHDINKKNVSRDKILKKGDVLINSTGVGTLGRVAQFKGSNQTTTVDSHVTIVRLDSPEIDIDFFGWLLKTLQPQFEALGEGSTGQTELSRLRIEEIEVNYPSFMSEQKFIAHILGTLDDKIELNRQMNQTLEAMAQALFKSWFVDFDPVIDNALKAGNPIPEPLQKKAQKRQVLGDRRQPFPEGIQRLFPNAFVHTEEMGYIPEGWEINTLGTVASELRRGISPKYLDADGVRVINQKCIRNHAINFELTRRHDPKARKIDGRELSIGDVLINSTGVGTLGRMAQVLHLTEVTIVDSHVTVVRSNPDFFYPFVFGQTLLSMEPKVESMGEGSTGQTELSRANLKELYLLAPPLPLQEIMEKQLIALANRQVKATDSSNYLSKIRDVLLPKLISGKLKVPKTQSKESH